MSLNPLPYIREYNNIESGIVEGEVCKALIYSGWTSAGLRIQMIDEASITCSADRKSIRTASAASAFPWAVTVPLG